jgi:hypothetical protein
VVTGPGGLRRQIDDCRVSLPGEDLTDKANYRTQAKEKDASAGGGGAVTPFLFWFVRLMLGADRDLTVIGETPAIGEHP